MRIISILLLVSLGYLQTKAQISLLHVTDGCSYDGIHLTDSLYAYDPSEEAERIVSEILDALGLEKNFTLKSANVHNAQAVSLDGTRYILYSTAFLEKFKADANTKWAAYSVLAHEIGHHLNGHNFGETILQKRKMLELEADRFSGSVLRMLGANLDEAQAGLNTFVLAGETNTHPSTHARKEAVSNGWKKRDEWILSGKKPNEQKFDNNPDRSLYPVRPGINNAAEWIQKGLNEDNVEKKIEYFTKALEIQSKSAYVYLLRAEAKDKINNYEAAILDLDTCIIIDSTYSEAYYARAYVKSKMDKKTEAILDYDKAIQFYPKYINAYIARGYLKHNLGKYAEAITDFDKSIRFCNKRQFQAVLQIDKNLINSCKEWKAFAYNNRGFSKSGLGLYKEALIDIDHSIRLYPNNAYAYANKGCVLVRLKRYGEAAENANFALKLDPNLPHARDCKAEALKELGKD